MKKNIQKLLCTFLTISILFISSFSTAAFAAKNVATSSKTSSSYSETYLDDNNQLHAKSKLVESTPEYKRFVAKVPVTLNTNGIKVDSATNSASGVETVTTDLFTDGRFKIQVECTGWMLISYGTINGLSTYGALGSRNYRASIFATNGSFPGPVLNFYHTFTGMSIYTSGTQYIKVGSGTLTLVNGYGSFSSFITDVTY